MTKLKEKTIEKRDSKNIKHNKGNIPINQKLLNKYSNVKDIFKDTNFYQSKTIEISYEKLNIKKEKASNIYHQAIELFHKTHNTNIFKNKGNIIHVTNTDIKESINKIYNDRLQNKLLEQHLAIFQNLGNIIKEAKLINQTFENKNRSKYNTWNYYYCRVKINQELYLLEFDIVSRIDDENHYRLQRLQKADTQSVLPIKRRD